MAYKTFLSACAIAVLVVMQPVMALGSDNAPFGVHQDALPSVLGCTPIYADTAMDTTGQYVCHSLPGGSAVFDQYILAFAKGFGICNITAVTPYMDDDARGMATREKFRQIASDMSAHYGNPDERVDHTVGPAASLDNAFNAGILSEDRQVFDQWNDIRKAGSNLESASLTISGGDDLGLAVFSVIRFAGNDACLKAVEATVGDQDDAN